jgi:hypothetical protein
MKYIKGRGEFLKKNTNNLDIINEEAPFENATKWGDSWIGRIVNSLLRKAGVGVSLVRMDKIIKEFKKTMKDINDGLSQIEEEVIKNPEPFKIIISSLIEELKRGVERGDSVDKLILMTTKTIEEIEKVEIENKESLIKSLKYFKEFLESLKNEDIVDTEDPGSTNVDKNPKKETITFGEKIFLLKELKIIIDNKESILTEEELNNKSKKFNKNINHNKINNTNNKKDTKDNETKPSENEVKLNVSGVENKETKPPEKEVKLNFSGDQKKETNSDNKIDDESKYEAYSLYKEYELILEKETIIYKNETYLTQAWTKLKKQLDVLGKNSIDSKYISEILEKAKEKDKDGKLVNKELINIFFNDIKEAYRKVGDMGPLFIKENISNLTDRQNVADKIARFAKVAMLFDQSNESFYGGLDILGKSLEKFNTLFKKFLNDSVSENKMNNEFKNLSKYNEFKNLSKYNEFKSLYIREDKEELSIVEKIKNKFNELIDVNKFIVSKEEQEKLNKELIKRSEEIKNTKVLYIDDVIGIVRLFNKAYKLHTTQVIPSGRTGGAVSNSVFREYWCFGSGTPANAGVQGGPYRNVKLFNEWESAVLDILGDSEYSSIFKKETKVGENSKDGGNKLKTFMINMLDGENLYKASSGGYSGDSSTGQQAKILKEYFGIDVKVTTTPTKPGDSSEISQIEETGGAINNTETKWGKIENKVLEVGNIFIIKYKKENEDNPKAKIGWVIKDGDKNENINILISNDFKEMRNSLIKIDNANIDVNITQPKLFKEDKKIFATYIKKSINPTGKKMIINSYEINTGEDGKEEGIIQEFIILKDKVSGKDISANYKGSFVIDLSKASETTIS